MSAPPTTRELLARILVDGAAIVRSGWCRGAPARDSAGYPVGATEEEACAWCAYGALRLAASRRGEPALVVEPAALALRNHLDEVLRPRRVMVSTWNDQVARSAEEVAGAMEVTAGLLVVTAAVT